MLFIFLTGISPLLGDLLATCDVDPLLIRSVIEQESGFRPEAVSPKGAVGLMQIMPLTGRSHCGVTFKELKSPSINVKCGCSYLKEQLRKYRSAVLALEAYYRGPSFVDRRIRENTPLSKSSEKYVTSVIGRYYRYRFLRSVRRVLQYERR